MEILMTLVRAFILMLMVIFALGFSFILLNGLFILINWLGIYAGLFLVLYLICLLITIAYDLGGDSPPS